MKPIISRPLHGLVADYPYVLVSAVAPWLFGFSENKKAVTLTRGIAAAALASALTTKAEWGAVKLIPYKAHVATDFAVGIFNLAAPFLFGFAGNRRARNTVLALGATAVAVSVLSGLFGGAEEEQ